MPCRFLLLETPIPGLNFATQMLDERRDMSMKCMSHEPLEYYFIICTYPRLLKALTKLPRW